MATVFIYIYIYTRVVPVAIQRQTWSGSDRWVDLISQVDLIGQLARVDLISLDLIGELARVDLISLDLIGELARWI